MDNYTQNMAVKFKKGVIQAFIWIVVTVAVYVVWGATWYFWVLFAISLVLVVALAFLKIATKKLGATLGELDTMRDDLDAFSYDDEENIEYTEQQKVLQRLLIELEEIGEEHGEIYDTECREQMREVIDNAFVFQKEDYTMPSTFGLYTPEGNERVAKALNKYLLGIEPLTQDVKTLKKRLEIFQDEEVYSPEGDTYDEFFGWVDEEDLGIVSQDIEETITMKTKIFGEHHYSTSKGLDFDVTSMVLNGKKSEFRGSVFEGLNSVQVEKVVVLLDAIEALDAKARDKWLSLLNEKDEEVCYFINEHYDAYGDEIRDEVYEKLGINQQDNKAFIKNLEFGSFHIVDGDDEDSVEIVMDYSLIWKNGTSFTDQILAMHFNDKLEYEMHTHDS